MKIGIHYFSGCGNSHWVANVVAQKLQQKGHTVSFVHLVGQPRLGEEKPDVEFFISPVYFLGLPSNVVCSINEMPAVADTKSVLLVVDGGMSGTARRYGRYLLEGRGYDVLATHQIVMPDTFLGLSISQLDKEQFDKDLKSADEQIENALMTLDNPMPVVVENWFSFGLSCLIYFPFLWFFRKCLGLSLVSTKNCIACGKCAASCPVQNIQMKDGRPVWNKNCCLCFRCVNHCPVSAIDLSKYALLFGLVGAFAVWMTMMVVSSSLGSVLSFLLKTAGFIVGFYLGCFVFQKKYANYPFEKGLFFAGKKRFKFFDEEKS